MSNFKREVRYTVIKHSQLTDAQIGFLKNCIHGEGIPTVEAVVVESDWPEFEPVWKMIEDRVAGAPVEGGKAEYDAMAKTLLANHSEEPLGVVEPVAYADKCEHCDKVTLGLSGSTKWCAYCGGKLAGETVAVESMRIASPSAPVAVDELQAIQDRHEAWMGGVAQGKAESAVVLPERCELDDGESTAVERAYARGANDMLDKVKELNQ